MQLGVNHITVPKCSSAELLVLAKALGCSGVECRNDLGRLLFDGEAAGDFATRLDDFGLDMHGLAEVAAFNLDTDAKLGDIAALMDVAVGVGAKGLALIPAVLDAPLSAAAQKAQLLQALERLQPLFEARGLIGLIEPLGFENSSLRLKAHVVDVLEHIGKPACFALIHDTFHHHTAGEAEVFADLTHIVHVSGVVDPAPARRDMRDAHRVLLDANDRTGAIAQLRLLQDAGFSGPISIEAFAPDVQTLSDPAPHLARSFEFISSQLAPVPA